MDLSDTSRLAPPPAPGASSVQLAKAALKRLALAKLDPTPENFARAYALESGDPAHGNLALSARARAVVDALATRAVEDASTRDELMRHLAAGRNDDALRCTERAAQLQREAQADRTQALGHTLERLFDAMSQQSTQWPMALKREGLRRVVDACRSEPDRLHVKLNNLAQAWEQGSADAPVPAEGVSATAVPAAGMPTAEPPPDATLPELATALMQTLRHALPEDDPRGQELDAEFKAMAVQMQEQVQPQGTELLPQARELCQRTDKLLAHRHSLLQDLARLCSELTEGLTELAEDGSWARGQCESMRQRLAEGISARSVRAASEMLAETRKRQQALRADRNEARDAIKQLISRMLIDVGRLGEDTGRYSESVGRHAEVISQAESLDDLADVVKQMVDESRVMQSSVAETQARLHEEHRRAADMESRVHSLESELRRLSDEVSTDMLTQVANRRGLMQAFEAEVARIARERPMRPAAGLAIGLIDIDNFKRLNDSLGHAAGDKALQALAAQVRDQLRPGDTVARFGGEEFVVLLPDLAADEAQVFLTKLQRKLTASLFMHENKEVFVTFSGGVTAWRDGEPLEASMERSDEALYEAKRTGKNRTCVS